ncbi:MAG: class I SAM-dependent methyltransferase [Methanoregula sp.]|nr:class I SAM-dependent methyltransferase [Methanoregula sp.]
MQISSLLDTIKKPILYEKGNAGMWEDDHISRHLIELHLNQDCDAASRKRGTIEKTVQWIETHLDTNQKSILDLGCGPGLYCELLAEHGHRVTGVDFSERSIAYARQSTLQKDLKIDYLQKNYLDLAFENQFDLVIMIFCDFDVLVPVDRTRLLKNIYRALKPGGLFIFDTLNPKAPAAMKIPGKSWEVADGGFWKNGPYLALSETFHYQEAKVILQQHIVCSEPDQHSVYRFWTHYYPHEILVSILNEGGFSVETTREDLLPDDGSGTHDMVTFYVACKT